MSELVTGLPLVDHHCHGLVREPLDRAGFEALLTEAEAPGPWHGSLFDSQVGFAVRSLCAPALDLEPFVAPDDYLARRAELGWEEVARRLLAPTGIADLVVDTGFWPDRLTAPAELGALAGARGHEITRLEHVAEQVLADRGPDRFPAAVRAELARCADRSLGFKSVAAYRGGLDLDPARPGDAEVQGAAERWAGSGAPRLTDRTIIRFLFWTAVDLRRPVQFHVGYGDADVDLHRCDPLLLTPLLRATAGLGVPVLLLHNYPFHRNAGYLAQVFDHVFVDVGLALHNVGSRAVALLAELLELAPFGSVLFSSDAFALPELYLVATTLFRRALAGFLDDGLARGFWPAAEAERIAAMITSGTAGRVYGLPGAAPA